MKRAVVIVSGGLDSTVLYFDLKAQGFDLVPIHFLYGSKHQRRETDSLARNVPGATQIVMRLPMGESSLMLPDVDVPKGHYAAENMKSTVVPFRNGIMLSYAVAVAESIGVDTVFYGAHSGDHAIYPDCRLDFVVAMSAAAQRGTYASVRIEAPFGSMSKTDIARRGRELEIEEIMALTYSCYNGEVLHCGRCGACNERKEAFQDAGVQDKTRYSA